MKGHFRELTGDLITLAGLFYLVLLVGGALTPRWLPLANQITSGPVASRSGSTFLASELVASTPVLVAAFIAGIIGPRFIHSKYPFFFIALLGLALALSAPSARPLDPPAGSSEHTEHLADSINRINLSIRRARIVMPAIYLVTPCLGAVLALTRRRRPVEQ